VRQDHTRSGAYDPLTDVVAEVVVWVIRRGECLLASVHHAVTTGL